ncbi:MAG: outer membrane protein assembly factor BamB family protein, partial [Kiritimatiellia bacterium]
CPTERLSELARIVAPGGALAIRRGLSESSPSVPGLTPLPALAGWALARKPLGPIGPFGPSDALRWRAGSRWQRISPRDFPSVAFGEGKLVYREGMPAVDGPNTLELVCRNAFNGRLLWQIEEEHFDAERWGSFLARRMGLAIAAGGRIYTGLGSDCVCLDAATGKILAVIEKGWRPVGQILIAKDRYLVCDGRIYDTADGKQTGTYRGIAPVTMNEVIFAASGRGDVISAFAIPDGRQIWSVNVRDEQPIGQFSWMFCSATALHVLRSWPAASLSTMDMRTGKTLWTYPPEPRPKVRDVQVWPFGDRLLIAYEDASISKPHDFVLREVEAYSGKVLREGLYAPGKKWAGGCWAPRQAGDFILYHHNTWLNVKTLERTYLLLFRPKCDQGPLPAYGMIYGFPGRKGGAIKGIAALAPRDIEYDAEPGGRVLVQHSEPPAPRPVIETDWPMFRANLSRGNTTAALLGTNLWLKWSANVGLGGKTRGAMDSERTGLAQATAAWGLVFVADIDGGRVVALDAESGAQKWSWHAGSRIAFSPTLHNGLAFLGAADGWVYCLDAMTGQLVYRLKIAPRERFIGGHDKLESMWPVANDVFIAHGTAFAVAGFATSIHGGLRLVAFDPATGKVRWSKCLQGKPTINDGEETPALFVADHRGGPVLMGGRAFDSATGTETSARPAKGILGGPNMEDWLAANNLLRISEDMGAAALGNGWIAGRLIAFDSEFGVGFSVARAEKSVLHIGRISLTGRSADGKTTWEGENGRLNVDDLLLTPDAVY